MVPEFIGSNGASDTLRAEDIRVAAVEETVRVLQPQENSIAADPGSLAAICEDANDNNNSEEFQYHEFFDEEPPRVCVEELKTAYSFIEGLKTTTLDNDGLPEEVLARLRKPHQQNIYYLRAS